jgi:FtsH-binding integral membrane protein
MYGGVGDGGENGLISSMGSGAFSEASIRRGFVRKVYGILTGQLVLTMAIIGIFYIPAVADYAVNNIWMFWVAFAMTFACLIALACCPDVRRKSPSNFICLGLFTLAEGFLLGCVAATYTKEEVLMALGICVILVIALTLFAWQTKVDFTAMGGILLVRFIYSFKLNS